MCFWKDALGNVLDATPFADINPLLVALKRDTMAKCWQTAAEHFNGKGLTEEPDFTVIRSFLKKESRKADGAAGVASTLATGGFWNQVRKAECYQDVDSLCRRCGQEPETSLHQLWSCPCNVPYGAKDKRDFLELRARALRPEARAVDCFWLRGLAPAEWTRFRNFPSTPPSL